jgi:hypothetical protein
MLSMCDVIKDTDIRNEVIRQDQLKNKRMANAEPECSRCCICGKNILDGGTFKRYNGKWYCLDCCDWIKKTKREAEFNKVRKTFEIKAGDK